MKLAIVKHRMAGLFRQANNPFIKCNFHSFFFIYHREKAHKNVHWMCLLAASLCATLSHTMSHLLLTRFFLCVYVCVHMSVHVQLPLCAHAEVRGGQWVSSRQDLSLCRKPHHFGLTSWPSDSWYLTVFASQCWSYKHMKLCPDFWFYLFFMYPRVYFSILLKIGSFLI